MLKIRDLPLRYVDDPDLSAHIALSFEYKNDGAVCLPQTTGHRSLRANWQTYDEGHECESLRFQRARKGL